MQELTDALNAIMARLDDLPLSMPRLVAARLIGKCRMDGKWPTAAFLAEAGYVQGGADLSEVLTEVCLELDNLPEQMCRARAMKLITGASAPAIVSGASVGQSSLPAAGPAPDAITLEMVTEWYDAREALRPEPETNGPDADEAGDESEGTEGGTA